MILRIGYHELNECMQQPFCISRAYENLGTHKRRPFIHSKDYARMLAANASIRNALGFVSELASPYDPDYSEPFNRETPANYIEDLKILAKYAKRRRDGEAYEPLSDRELLAVTNMIRKLSPQKHHWARRIENYNSWFFKKYVFKKSIYYPEMIMRIINGQMILTGSEIERTVIELMDSSFSYLNAAEEITEINNSLSAPWTPDSPYDWAKMLGRKYVGFFSTEKDTSVWGPTALVLGKMAEKLGALDPHFDSRSLVTATDEKYRLLKVALVTKALNSIRYMIEGDADKARDFYLGREDYEYLKKTAIEEYEHWQKNEIELTKDESALLELLKNPLTQHIVDFYKNNQYKLLKYKNYYAKEGFHEVDGDGFPLCGSMLGAVNSNIDREATLCRAIDLEALYKKIKER